MFSTLFALTCIVDFEYCRVDEVSSLVWSASQLRMTCRHGLLAKSSTASSLAKDNISEQRRRDQDPACTRHILCGVAV